MEYAMKSDRQADSPERGERMPPIGALVKIQIERIGQILDVIERMSVFMYGEGIQAAEKNEARCFQDLMIENTRLLGHALNQLCRVNERMNE